MNILCLDTCSAACSVALQTGDQVTERCELSRSGHGRLLLGMVDALLAEAGLRPPNLDLVACTRGPGAFTGVRIGIAVAQGIALAASIPVAAVSSLAMLAQNGASESGFAGIAAAMDARMGEVYWGLYRAEGGVAVALEAERVSPPAAIPSLNSGPWLGVGDGWQVYPGALEAATGQAIQILREAPYPRARHLVPLAKRAFDSGRCVTAEALYPVYLRDNVVNPPIGGR